MLLGRYRQQPGDKLKRVVDYTHWLEPGETILSVVVKSITPATDNPLLCPMVIVDPAANRKFAYYLTGGESGISYTVTFTVTTQTQIREDEIEVDVEEIS